MCIENVATNVPDGEHTEVVPTCSLDIFEVVGHVYGDEDGTCEEGNGGEQRSHKSKEPEKRDSVKANLINQLGLLCVYEWREPSKYRVRYPRRRLASDMVFDLGFIYDLDNSISSQVNTVA